MWINRNEYNREIAYYCARINRLEVELTSLRKFSETLKDNNQRLADGNLGLQQRLEESQREMQETEKTNATACTKIRSVKLSLSIATNQLATLEGIFCPSPDEPDEVEVSEEEMSRIEQVPEDSESSSKE